MSFGDKLLFQYITVWVFNIMFSLNYTLKLYILNTEQILKIQLNIQILKVLRFCNTAPILMCSTGFWA